MRDKLRGCAAVVAIFSTVLISAVCSQQDEAKPRMVTAGGQQSGDSHAARAAESASEQPMPQAARTAVAAPSDAPAESPTAQTQGAAGEVSPALSSGETGPPAYVIRQRFRPGDVLYYLIENELRDSVQITGPIPLGSTTRVWDRRSIIQRVESVRDREGAAARDDGLVEVSWECDRYEVRERGMKDEVTFDSLRHTYPPPSLRMLGGTAGSRSTFLVDPATGKVSRIRTILSSVSGPTTRQRSSKTAEKCRLTSANLQKLLTDMGPLFFPEGPHLVGDRWTKTQRETVKAFGTVVTELTCMLREVNEADGRRIAVIDLAGDVRLEPKPEPSTSAPARAGRRLRSGSAKRSYKIDKARCSGTVRFDVTRGELVELTLHREIDFLAELESKDPKTPSAGIKSGSAQTLRIKASHTPPPKPVIVGGPKPPVLPPGLQAAGRGTRPPTTTRGATSRGSDPGSPRKRGDRAEAKRRRQQLLRSGGRATTQPGKKRPRRPRIPPRLKPRRDAPAGVKPTSRPAPAPVP